MKSVTTRSACITAIALMLLLSACSSTTLKRLSFETLQNLGAQHCTENLGRSCPPLESYQDYRYHRRMALEHDQPAFPRS